MSYCLMAAVAGVKLHVPVCNFLSAAVLASVFSQEQSPTPQYWDYED